MVSTKLNNFDFFSLFCTIFIAYYVTDYIKLNKQIKEQASELNITKKLNTSVLMFNRTPKAGSETLWGLIDILANRNNFTSCSDSAEEKKRRGSENTFLSYEERKKYVYMLNEIDHEFPNVTVPYTYIKHINFLNFEEFNFTNPIYVNMVRHPVERVISWFYYIRQNTYLLEHDKTYNTTKLHQRTGPPKYYKYTYDECVLEKHNECTYPIGTPIHRGFYGGSHFSQISFFCGMDPLCDEFGSQQALEMAKSNVERYYAVVGVLEKWDDTLRVLENYVPRFFTNARKVYKEMMHNKPQNKNKWKIKAAKEIKDMIRGNFTTEIEFYNFCKQRLYRQMLTIG